MNKTKITREDISRRFKEANCLDLQKIHVQMGELQNIGACHLNARQGIETGEYPFAIKVILMAPTGLLRVHWVNRTLDDKYIDDTLGYMCYDRTYFLMQEYDISQLKGTNMETIQTEVKNDFIKQLYTPEELETMEFDLLDL